MKNRTTRVFTIYDATWPNCDDVAQGSAQMDGDRCVEYQIRQVEAHTKNRALEIFQGEEPAEDEALLDTVEYTLDPPKSDALTIVIHDAGGGRSA